MSDKFLLGPLGKAFQDRRTTLFLFFPKCRFFFHTWGKISAVFIGATAVLESYMPPELRSKSTGNDSSFLKTLTKHIEVQLGERGFCVVFEDDLERCWPSNQMTEAGRKNEIHRFAESQGWSATIVEGVFGARAIFED